MAQVNIQSGWMTSFIYKQDLTSYYMNNILTGAFRPGIYNANIALVADMQDSTLYLSVKKGTTLMFSNSYKNFSSNYGIIRNFSGVDSTYNPATDTEKEGLVLIKCVAQNDILQKLGKISGTDALFGTDSKELYVFAYMNYFKGQESPEPTTPIFLLAKKNVSSGPSDASYKEGFLYETVLPVYSPSQIVYKENPVTDRYIIPDGCLNYSAAISKNLENYSFLMLGSISYLGSNNVNTFPRRLTFTGRGLPEYRYSMVGDSSSMGPSIIVDSRTTENNAFISGKNIYVDIPDTLLSDTLCKNRVVSGSEDLEELSWMCGHDICYSSLIPSNFNNKLLSMGVNNITISGKKILIDFIFGKINTLATDTLSLNFTSTESSLSLDKRSFLYDVSDVSGYEPFYYLKDTFWYNTSDGSINVNSCYTIPLDISQRNILRLSKIIVNKNLWEQVVDMIRREENSFNTSKSDIVPIAISFRSLSTDSDSSDYLAQVPNSNIYAMSFMEDLSRINSINMLSYFDLAATKNKANVLNIKMSNIYNQIPIR